MTPRWSVTHVCRTGWPATGGLEQAVRGLAEAQAAAGHRVTVVTLDHGGTGERLHPCERRHVVWRRLPRLGPRRYPFARGLRRMVADADLVHVHGVDGLADQLVHAPGGPPVGVSTHGGYFHTRRQAPIKRVWVRTVTRATFRRAGAVWYTSESDRRLFAGAGRAGPVIPNGIDLAPFRTVVRRPEAGRWLVLGRVDVHKGVDDLCDAVARWMAERPPLRIEVVGPFASRAVQRRLVQRVERLGLSGVIHFRGRRSLPEVLDHLGRAELALFPSRREGFGIAAIEAMAAGVPVVVSHADAFRGHIEAGAAHAVDFHRPDRAAAELARLRPHHAGGTVPNARARAATFSFEAVGRAYDDAYQTLLAT